MSPRTTEWDDEEVKVGKPRMAAKPPRGAGCFVALVLSLIILVAMGLMGLQTKVGADLVAGYLKRHTGVDFSVGGAQFMAPMDLLITDLQTKPSTTPLGSFKAREVQIGWRWGGETRLMVRGLRLEMVKIADGWVPVAFTNVANLMDVRETVDLVAGDPSLVALDIIDSALLWSSPDGERMAGVDGLNASMRPVMLGDRPVRIFDVAARTVYRNGGVKGRLLHRMWVSTVDNPYLEVDYSGVWEGDEASQKDWWSIPSGSAKRGMAR